MIEELDNETLCKVGKLLINMAEWFLEFGPIPGEPPTREAAYYATYESNSEYVKYYNMLEQDIRLVENDMSRDDIIDLFVVLAEHNDYNCEFLNSDCSLDLAFKDFCQEAYEMMNDKELDEIITTQINAEEWTEIDAIIYTYLEYLKKSNQ